MATSKNTSIVLAVVIILAALLIFRAFFFVFPFGSVFGAFRVMKGTVPPMWDLNGHHLLGFPATVIPLLLMTLIWLAVVIWVYRDAEKRGMNGLLWALLVFIGSIVGLIIYLIVRTEPGTRLVNGSAKEACPSCGKDVAAGFVFCPHCGSRVKPVCPSCQKPVDKSWKACPYCGVPLNP
ncbi:MAG: zinc ribbon domain-containing protein [Candidatus Aminicenantes bacterium]|nr:zinc ribbon domain-containing protein [Candidatus Aminicenantes bacterium]